MEISIKILEDLHNSIDSTHFYLDIDGCLIHSCEAIVEILNKKYNKSITAQEISSWNFTCHYPNMTDEDIEWLFSTDEFFNIVKFQKGAYEFLDKYRDSITLVSKGTNKNLRLKRLFFDLYGFSDIKLIGIPLDQSKSIVDMSNGIFIDDCTYNLVESNAKIKVLFKEYDNFTEWSQGWNGFVLRSWK